MIRNVIVNGGYSQYCPPTKVNGDNITQIIKGVEFQYPIMKHKFYETKWDIVAKNTKENTEFKYDDIMLSTDLSLSKFDTIEFTPNPEGNAIIAPLLLSAMASMATAAGATGFAAAATAAASMTTAAAIGAGGMVAVAGVIGAIGSGLIMMGAMYGLGQLFQPSQPKINDPSAASGGDRGSFLYNSPPNVTEQGHPIPIIYGKVRTGGTAIAAELSTAKYTYKKKKWIPS